MGDYYKRKRYVPKGMGIAKPRGTARAPMAKRRKFVAGVNRTSGYYGRFAKGGETKFFDFPFEDSTVDNDGTIEESINKIPQGTGESERIGRKCTIKKVRWKYLVELPEKQQAVPVSNDTCRVILYLDKQANGAAPTVLDILQTRDILSFRNLANQMRFEILMDKNFDIEYASAYFNTDTNAFAVADTLISGTYSKTCNIPIEFNGTQGSLSEIRSNNIGILTISKHGKVGFLSELRIRFSDN